MHLKPSLVAAVFLSVFASAALPAHAAQASPPLTGLALAKTKNCFACHALTTRVVGPSYLAVAEKYAKKPDAEEILTAKVLKGGAGVWGAVPMPANGQVSPDEARQLVRWVLSVKG